MSKAEQFCLKTAKLYDGFGWIPYHGDGCPLAYGAIIDARYRNGAVITNVKVRRFWGMAQRSHWNHQGYGWEIVEYKQKDNQP